MQDEVEAEIHHRRGVYFLADAVAGLRQGLVALQGVVAEGNESGHPRVGRCQRAQSVVVVAVEMHVRVNQAGQHELALSIDDPLGARQQVLGSHGHDLLALDRHRGVKDLRRCNDLPAADYGVDSRFCCHGAPPQFCVDQSNIRRIISGLLGIPQLEFPIDQERPSMYLLAPLVYRGPPLPLEFCLQHLDEMTGGCLLGPFLYSSRVEKER